MKKIKNNIPNLITISRIVSCILGAGFFIYGNVLVAVLCYVYGAISDAFDGYLARKWDVVSDFGKKIDPISDKLYALSLMAPSIVLGNYSMIITLVLEALISFVNIYSEIKYKKTYTEKIGKIKTILLFPTMILGLLATKIPYFYVAFVPSLVISSEYQAKALHAYYNQLEKFKKQDEESKIKVSSSVEKNDNEKLLDNKISNKIIKKSTMKRSKKLVRKKD